MTTFTEGRHTAEFLLSEANFHRSRDVARLIASQTIAPGTMIDQQPVLPEVVATASAADGNTGNATIAMDDTTPVNTAVKEGRYVGTATAPGDKFYINVVIKKFVHLARANDSVLTVAGVALYPATTGSGEAGEVAMITRDAEVKGVALDWPAGITADQKIVATKGLAARGIIIR